MVGKTGSKSAIRKQKFFRKQQRALKLETAHFKSLVSCLYLVLFLLSFSLPCLCVKYSRSASHPKGFMPL